VSTGAGEAVRVSADEGGFFHEGPDGHSTPPGATDEVDAALLRLCRLMIAATLQAGTGQQPPLPLSQIRTLTMLAAARNGLSLGQLGAYLGQKPPAVTSLSGQLVQSGLATRSAGPGTEIRLSLLPAGAQMLAAVNRDRLHRLRGLLATLPAVDRTAVLQALARFGGGSAGGEEPW
jgi:DNA-binding MarR family transcriptional regulator